MHTCLCVFVCVNMYLQIYMCAAITLNAGNDSNKLFKESVK